MFQCIGQYLYSFSFKHIKTPPTPLIFVMFSYLLTRLCFARLFLSTLLSCLRYCCVLGYSKHIFHLCCQQGSCKYLKKGKKRKYWNFKYPNMGNSWTRWIKKMLKECVSLTFL